MKATNLLKKINSLGGKANFTFTPYISLEGLDLTRTELVGELNGYDINASVRNEEVHFFTIRKISMRGYDDQGSDYNSGGYIFLEKLTQLEHFSSK